MMPVREAQCMGGGSRASTALLPAAGGTVAGHGLHADTAIEACSCWSSTLLH